MSNLQISSFAGDPLTWTAVPAPLGGCRGATIINGGAVDMKMRTDPNSAATEVTCPSGTGEAIMPAGIYKVFASAETIIYFQPTSGVGPAVLHALL